ncbi:MAG: putative alpha-E superfamily protein [Candidatus Azotimanducaceae bacterium]|jgi:uncharacterized alpha-E superfamily protein
MLSQAAERVYWFSRYLERTENIARLMLVRHQLILDLPTSIQPDWRLLVQMLGTEQGFDKCEKPDDEKNIISFVFSDRKNPSSVISSIASARENIRTTREIMPSETWERVNSLYLSVAERSDKNLPRSQRHKVLNNIIQACQQITGLLSGAMNHDAAYQFILLGRNIERADMSTRIVDIGSSSLHGSAEEKLPYRNVLWISILRSLSAYQMYRLNVRRNVKSEAVLNFLLKSDVFPRATAHNLVELEVCVKKLSNHSLPLEAIRRLSSLLHDIDLTVMRDEKLHVFIDELQAELGNIHNQISDTWLHPEL